MKTVCYNNGIEEKNLLLFQPEMSFDVYLGATYKKGSKKSCDLYLKSGMEM